MNDLAQQTDNDFEVVTFDEIADCKILIIDDVAVLRMLIKTCLEKSGFTNLVLAESGDAALEMLEEVNPDLIILDIIMPGIDGFEVCRRIRNDDTHKNTPILIQTGMEANNERAAVFEAGANDLISKPINVPELIARVRLQLKHLTMERKQRAYRARLEEELLAATLVQQSLIPNAQAIEAVEQHMPVKIQSFWQASTELGGDLWGMRQLDENHLGFYIIDFSGHGVVAALNTFRLHTLIGEADMDWYDPVDCLSTVNSHLKKVLAVEQFATLFWGVFDFTKDELTYSAAAAPPIILGNTDDASMLDTRGVPVGFVADGGYEKQTVKFGPGDYLFLYSDALIESPFRGDGKMLEEEGLFNLVKQFARESGPEGVHPATMERFMAESIKPIPDDLTAVCFVNRK